MRLNKTDKSAILSALKLASSEISNNAKLWASRQEKYCLPDNKNYLGDEMSRQIQEERVAAVRKQYDDLSDLMRRVEAA